MSRTESFLARLQRGEPTSEFAQAAVDPSARRALAGSGRVPVPVKPTPEMIAAGIAAGSVSARVAFEIYQAMIAGAE